MEFSCNFPLKPINWMISCCAILYCASQHSQVWCSQPGGWKPTTNFVWFNGKALVCFNMINAKKHNKGMNLAIQRLIPWKTSGRQGMLANRQTIQFGSRGISSVCFSRSLIIQVWTVVSLANYRDRDTFLRNWQPWSDHLPQLWLPQLHLNLMGH